MAAKQEIEALFSGQWDHRGALHVFVKYGGSDILASLIDVDNTYNRMKLKQELRLLQENVQEQIDEKLLIELPEDTPGEIQTLIDRRQECYRERDQLFAQMMHIEDEVDRGKSALRQLDLDDEINEIWEKIHHWKDHGTLPMEQVQTQEVNIEDPLELMKIHTRNKNYIWKNEKKKAISEKVQKEINRRKAENAEIEKKLNLNG